MKFGQVLQQVQCTRYLSLSAINFTSQSDQTDTTSDRTTHFGFETVTEAEKGKKGFYPVIIFAHTHTHTHTCTYI